MAAVRCPWCGKTARGPTCGGCGHRVDVARMDCRCGRCVAGRRTVKLVLLGADGAAERPTLRVFRG